MAGTWESAKRWQAGAEKVDQRFDAGTLSELRIAVLAAAAAAGLPERRARDVVLAVHELAANAIRHDGGSGRARMHVEGGQLRCRVTDIGYTPPGQAWPWPLNPGHGLWLVHNLADQVTVAPSTTGSEVTAMFSLSFSA